MLWCYPGTHLCIFWINSFTKPTWLRKWQMTYKLSSWVLGVCETLHLHLSWHLLTFENPLYYFKSFQTDVSHFRYIPVYFCLTSNIPCASSWGTRAMKGCKYHASWKRKRLWWLSMAGRGKWRLATYFIQLLIDLFFCLLSFALVSSFLKGILTKVIINQKNVKRINRSWLGGTAFLCEKETQRNRVTITRLCREIRLYWLEWQYVAHINTARKHGGMWWVGIYRKHL